MVEFWNRSRQLALVYYPTASVNMRVVNKATGQQAMLALSQDKHTTELHMTNMADSTQTYRWHIHNDPDTMIFVALFHCRML